MKKKLLSTAIAAGMGMGLMSTAAQAVYVNPEGTGDVLLYPYYSAENDNNTYVEVVNTSSVGKAVKVRFVESHNSREVLDFNLYLSPNDVWTGAVVPTADGGGMLVSNDKSCTTPRIPSDGIAFRTLAFDGDDVTRTAAGHIEIISMGDIVADTDLDDAITHVAGELPTDTTLTCADMQSTTYDPGTDVTGSTGGLYGFATLLNNENGIAAEMDATALEDFSNTELWADPGTTDPSLTDVSTAAYVFDGNGGVQQFDPPVFGVASDNGDAVSAVLMTAALRNSFMLDPGVQGKTDWIVTFPTKTLYVNDGSVNDPFTVAWDGEEACEPVINTVYDREEQTRGSGQVDFSPAPTSDPNSLCYEANVITFNGSNLIGASEAYGVDVDYDNGWMDLAFATQSFTTATPGTGLAGEGYTLGGLPAIGYALHQYSNGTIGGVLRNYMGASAHKRSGVLVAP